MNIAEQIALKYIKSYQCNSYQHCFQDTSRLCIDIRNHRRIQLSSLAAQSPYDS